jgi:hypothetical protein
VNSIIDLSLKEGASNCPIIQRKRGITHRFKKSDLHKKLL